MAQLAREASRLDALPSGERSSSSPGPNWTEQIKVEKEEEEEEVVEG